MNWKWYKPKSSKPKHQCPCCDYISLPERGSYLICPICFWEDDGIDVNELDIHSGPNHMTLREGRENFMKYGACDLKMVKNVISETKREKFELIKRNLI